MLLGVVLSHASILYLLIHSRSTTSTYISPTQHLQFILAFYTFVRILLGVKLLYVSTIVIVPRIVS